MSDQCLFCGIVAGDIASVRVAEDDETYAFMDINPTADGHLLVVPKRHSTDLLDISPDDLAAVTATAQRIAKDRLLLAWVPMPGDPGTITALGEQLAAALG